MDTKELWQEYNHQLRQFLQSRVNNPADVDDLLQTILIKTYQNAHTINHPGKVQSWLFQIARNTLIDHYRKSHSNHVDINIDGLSQTAEGTEEYEQVRQSLANCIRPFLNQLPDKYREALEWTELQGKSQKELAAELGLSYSAVKSRVQRGRRMLKTLFRQCCVYQYDARGNPIEFEVSSTGCNTCDQGQKTKQLNRTC